jgi:hypothetical protein
MASLFIGTPGEYVYGEGPKARLLWDVNTGTWCLDVEGKSSEVRIFRTSARVA